MSTLQTGKNTNIMRKIYQSSRSLMIKMLSGNKIYIFFQISAVKSNCQIFFINAFAMPVIFTHTIQDTHQRPISIKNILELLNAGKRTASAMAVTQWQELSVELEHVKHFNFSKKVKKYIYIFISKANPLSELIIAYNILRSYYTL